ncbi:MAG: amino acid ABC transporter substrate-binding protein [Lachnospiraceae bacterium]|nr:amino acid ABC transporter substrate-binding protein [Lachnospiraceae bacterium]
MKKRIALTMATMMLATALTGCGSSKEETFTVGFDANFPPYGYADESGEYTGFDLELAQAVCDKEGWTLVKQPIDWDAKDMELSSGAIDCIWNGFTINGREDAYTWTDPYIDNSQVYVVAEDAAVNTPADLSGMILGVQKDSSALAALNDEANADFKASLGDVVEYDDYNLGFMDLEAGAIDALAMDIGVAAYQIESRGTGFRMLDENLATEQYAVGFLLGNEELRDTVQSALYELYEEGVVGELAEKYGLSDFLCMEKYK